MDTYSFCITVLHQFIDKSSEITFFEYDRLKELEKILSGFDSNQIEFILDNSTVSEVQTILTDNGREYWIDFCIAVLRLHIDRMLSGKDEIEKQVHKAIIKFEENIALEKETRHNEAVIDFLTSKTYVKKWGEYFSDLEKGSGLTTVPVIKKQVEKDIFRRTGIKINNNMYSPDPEIKHKFEESKLWRQFKDDVKWEFKDEDERKKMLIVLTQIVFFNGKMVELSELKKKDAMFIDFHLQQENDCKFEESNKSIQVTINTTDRGIIISNSSVYGMYKGIPVIDNNIGFFHCSIYVDFEKKEYRNIWNFYKSFPDMCKCKIIAPNPWWKFGAKTFSEKRKECRKCSSSEFKCDYKNGNCIRTNEKCLSKSERDEYLLRRRQYDVKKKKKQIISNINEKFHQIMKNSDHKNTNNSETMTLNLEHEERMIDHKRKCTDMIDLDDLNELDELDEVKLTDLFVRCLNLKMSETQ